MEIINRRLTLNEFRDYVKGYYFGSLPADKLVIHHTWRPTKEFWDGESTILALKRYYENKDWKAGPHLFIAEERIWLFSPMRKDGIHAGRLNLRSIGIEIVGNYDTEKWSGQTKTNALGAIKALMERLNITENNFFFHRDVSPKSCPGWAITKEWLFQELSDFRFPSIGGSASGGKPRIPTSSEFRERVDELSSPIRTTYSFETVPEWAEEAKNFVEKHKLFQIRTPEDLRDAVKFYRFYQLIDSEYEE